MDGKLFPPILETKLPAFAVRSEFDEAIQNTVSIEEMIIPFQMNKAVALGDISKMSLIVKTAQTGKKLGVLTSAGQPAETVSGFSVAFDCSSLNLEVGQYYKVQLAYINLNDEIGYYSQAGIIKKTSEPTLKILELKDDLSITNRFEYTGSYQQTEDTSEKVYSYCFTISDLKHNIISTSGECLHNSSKDESNSESHDSWINNADLTYDESYIFSYKIKTINGYEAERSYIVTTTESVNIDLNIDLETKLNYEDGLVELYLLPRTGKRSVVTGDFVLVRASSLTDFKFWDPVEEFHYVNVELSSATPLLLWEDYLIEQGETYRYAIQAYNSNRLYSNRLEAKNGRIQANFEYCFLSDAEHQLKIKFNPKISSLKTTVVESKVNTLGNKYPFIFKNGYVEYKEFPISGLLSLLSDENGKFNLKYSQEKRFDKRITTPGGGQDATYYHDLSDDNIYSERQFKLEVLNWLNNGQPKLFRSPTEGNYIVRLMNSSLAPNDTLGRMLHTFSTTACEVAEYNFTNIKQLNLISSPRSRTSTVRIGQIIPRDLFADPNRVKNYPKLTFTGTTKISLPPSYSVSIVDAEPGTQFEIGFVGSTPRTIEIGGTGAYIVPIAKAPNSYGETLYVQFIKLKKGDWRDTKVNFEYYEDKPFDTFSEICDISIQDEIRRFVGYDFDVNLVQDTSEITSNFNCVLTDIKRDLGRFHFIRIEKRYVQEMWPNGKGQYSRTEIPSTDIIQDDEWNPLIIYHDAKNNIYYDGGLNKRMVSEPDYRFSLNDDYSYSYLGFNPTETRLNSDFSQSFGRIDSIRNIDRVYSLKVGSGLMVDIGYRVKIKKYSVENGRLKDSAEFKNYTQAKLSINNFFASPGSDKNKDKYLELINTLNITYKAYIRKLKSELQ